jgi:cytochrome c5
MKTAIRSLGLVLSLTMWAAGGSSVAAAQDARAAEIEKGRNAVTAVCTGCHDNGILRIVEVRQKSVDEWRDTVYKMIGRGAHIMPDEIEPITLYLSSVRRPQQTAGAGAGAGSDAAGEGPAILARRCRLCHDVERATTLPAGKNWDAIIDQMTALGAVLTPAERRTLLVHLSTRK